MAALDERAGVHDDRVGRWTARSLTAKPASAQAADRHGVAVSTSFFAHPMVMNADGGRRSLLETSVFGSTSEILSDS